MTEVQPSIHESTARARIEAEIARTWPQAQHYWSRFLLLNEPDLSTESESVAQIQLRTRQVTLNDELIARHDLFDCVEGLLAHEIGHHVRYPGTLVVEARMRMLEKSIIPLAGYSLTNVFQDLMINEFLGDALRDQFIRVYQAFTSEPAFHADMRWKRDPAFLFYLALYEALWNQEAGSLMGGVEPEFAAAFSGYRAEAHVTVHNLFRMEPNLYTQFLYFTSVMTRYLKPMIDQQLEQWMACRCGGDQPSPDDWADALLPTDAEQQAIERAVKSGWFAEDQAERLRKLNELEERIASLPGFGTDDASLIPEVMAAHYRQLAERHLLRPPPLPRLGEAIVPTTLDEWEFSDPIRDIDWLTTLTHRGQELGAAQPLKRIPIAETEGYDVRLWQPRMEIYLDVSGSMPNPIYHLNAMTLAAQILTLGTTRAGGSVRAALYSHEPVLYWSWCRSDVEVSRFLMHYIGGGTDFPFQLLRKSCEECGPDQPLRVVISDSDFDHNYEANPENRGVFISAAVSLPHWILLLHRPEPDRVKLYRSLGATVIVIEEMGDFPRLAADLTHSLFPDDSA
ncbi:MAG: hypothetical protein RIC55_03575 [Pirellulaceae bacterium]